MPCQSSSVSRSHFVTIRTAAAREENRTTTPWPRCWHGTLISAINHYCNKVTDTEQGHLLSRFVKLQRMTQVGFLSTGHHLNSNASDFVAPSNLMVPTFVGRGGSLSCPSVTTCMCFSLVNEANEPILCKQMDHGDLHLEPRA